MPNIESNKDAKESKLFRNSLLVLGTVAAGATIGEGMYRSATGKSSTGADIWKKKGKKKAKNSATQAIADGSRNPLQDLYGDEAAQQVSKDVWEQIARPENYNPDGKQYKVVPGKDGPSLELDASWLERTKNKLSGDKNLSAFNESLKEHGADRYYSSKAMAYDGLARRADELGINISHDNLLDASSFISGYDPLDPDHAGELLSDLKVTNDMWKKDVNI